MPACIGASILVGQEPSNKHRTDRINEQDRKGDGSENLPSDILRERYRPKQHSDVDGQSEQKEMEGLDVRQIPTSKVVVCGSKDSRRDNDPTAHRGSWATNRNPTDRGNSRSNQGGQSSSEKPRDADKDRAAIENDPWRKRHRRKHPDNRSRTKDHSCENPARQGSAILVSEDHGIAHT